MAEALKAMDGFTFGCDPELFVVDTNGEFVSAEGLLPGTKSEPFTVPHGAVQVDGMAAEFNIDPCTTYEEWDSSIYLVMNSLLKMLPTGYTLKAVPSVNFSKTVWDSAPDKAKELGCSPDFNAWTGEVNTPPRRPARSRLCTAAGHIHIGWTKGMPPSDETHAQNCRDLVKQLDWFLGGWSVGFDPDSTRRRLYGKAGAMRYKPYGVEYRVLSNTWVRKSSTRLAVWNRLQSAILSMRDSFIPEDERLFQHNDRLIRSINQSKRDTLLESAFAFPIQYLKED